MLSDKSTTPGTSIPTGVSCYFNTKQDRDFLVRCTLKSVQHGLTTVTDVDHETADCMGFLLGFAVSLMDETFPDEEPED